MPVTYETNQELTEKLVERRNSTLARIEELKAGAGFPGEEYNMLAQLEVLNLALTQYDPDYTSIQKERNLAYEIAMENGISISQVFTLEREEEWAARKAQVFKKHGLVNA